MTAQRAERLVFHRKEQRLFSNPLEGVFSDTFPRPEFSGGSTALWRGYIGSWEVRDDDRLFLTGIEAQVDRRPFGLADLFPTAPPNGVFADWCSEVLRIPLGRGIAYEHMGYESEYERDLFLAVRRGLVVYEEEVANPAKTVIRRAVTGHLDAAFGPDEAAFLRGIVEDPADPVRRLAFADWLQERDDPRHLAVRMDAEWRTMPESDDREQVRVRLRDQLGDDAEWVWNRIMGFPVGVTEWWRARRRAGL